MSKQSDADPYEDVTCSCGHGHDASHDPDGQCLAQDCECVNDGASDMTEAEFDTAFATERASRGRWTLWRESLQRLAPAEPMPEASQP